MELIRRLPAIKDNNGRWQSYGEFLCPFCLKKVIKYLGHGKRDLSCGCNRNKLISESTKGENGFWYGKKLTKEHKQKIKDNHVGNRGNECSEETKQKISSANKGKKRTDKIKQKISEIQKTKTGNLAPNWQNGKSFEPYPPEFNKKLKHLILERDNYTCQCPDCEHKTDVLDIHHIDFNKQNNTPENLIALCNSCHAKTNGKNRDYWINYYQQLL